MRWTVSGTYSSPQVPESTHKVSRHQDTGSSSVFETFSANPNPSPLNEKKMPPINRGYSSCSTNSSCHYSPVVSYKSLSTKTNSSLKGMQLNMPNTSRELSDTNGRDATTGLRWREKRCVANISLSGPLITNQNFHYHRTVLSQPSGPNIVVSNLGKKKNLSQHIIGGSAVRQPSTVIVPSSRYDKNYNEFTRPYITRGSSDIHKRIQMGITQRIIDSKQAKYDLVNLIIPVDKQWSEIGLSVYRVGVGMYHSSLVVDDLEWHFWEGLGVEPLLRYFDDMQEAYVSVDHAPFVTYVAIDTLMVPPRAIAQLCEEMGQSNFSRFTYDIIRCNCNHFTHAMLERLGLVSKMPSWINRLAQTADTVCTRLPFVRNWIDSILNRKTVINRNVPQIERLPSTSVRQPYKKNNKQDQNLGYRTDDITTYSSESSSLQETTEDPSFSNDDEESMQSYNSLIDTNKSDDQLTYKEFGHTPNCSYVSPALTPQAAFSCQSPTVLPVFGKSLDQYPPNSTQQLTENSFLQGIPCYPMSATGKYPADMTTKLSATTPFTFQKFQNSST